MVFTVIAYLTEFLGILPFSKLIQLMAISFVVKLSLSPILIFPTMITAKFLKRVEGIDVYDYNTNFNPFEFRLTHEKINKSPNLENDNIINFFDLKKKKISKRSNVRK